MKKLFTLFVIMITAFGHSQNCECTENQKEMFKIPPMDVFEFGSGEKLRICPAIRYSFEDDPEIYFKDFRIEDCKNDSLLKYWTGLLCKVDFINDTLMIRKTVKLPLGNNRKIQAITKSLTRIYFKDETIIVDHKEMPIRKYSHDEIQAVLNEYNSAIKRERLKIQHLYSSLVVAALSGSDEAKSMLSILKKNLEIL